MKNISYILVLVLLLSCNSNSFQYKTTDFRGYYSEGFKNKAHQLPKFRNGWFELRIKEEPESIDGVEVRKFVIDPDLSFYINPQPASFEFYCYIAFVDNHRLVFYTPYRGSPSRINKEFNLFDRKQSDFQRGYYLYQHPSNSDTTGTLKVLFENRKKDRPTELIFEVQYDKNTDNSLAASSLKLIQMNGQNDTPLNSKSPKSTREYMSADLFSFQPTYFFEDKRSLKMIAKEKRGNLMQIDSIMIDTAKRERYYYYEDQLLFKEALRGQSARDSLRSW